ncbi:MAG: hypothetical protein JXX14_12700 [Deltaproteobacteria bacterium]|nr:hypothetical protein [Deltaproteobacteria bacterium]
MSNLPQWANSARVMALIFFVLGCAAAHSPAHKTETLSENRTFLSAPTIPQLEKQFKSSNREGDLFVLATLYDKTGRPELAFNTYIQAMDAASISPGLYWEGIGAAIGIVNIRRRVRDFENRIYPHLMKWSASPGALAPEALYQLRTLTFSFALKKGKMKHASQLLNQTGCITDWLVAGPIATDKRGAISSKQLLDSRVWPREIDAGAGRPNMPVVHKSLGICQLTAPPVSSASTGTIIGTTAIHVSSTGDASFRLHSTSDSKIFINGHQVYSQQSQTRWLPETRWFTVWLPAGHHQITVQVFSPTFEPSFSLSVLSSSQRPLTNNSTTLPVTTEYKPNKGITRIDSKMTGESTILARMQYALWNVDPYEWQEYAKMLDEKLPLHRLFIAAYQLMTPFNAPEVAMESARHLYAGVLSKMPTAFEASVYLAKQAHSNGRTEESIGMLKNAIAAMPDEPMLPLVLTEIAFEKEWIPETRKYLSMATDMLGDNCETLQWRYAVALHEKKFDATMQLAHSISQCAASSTDLATELTREGDFMGASNILWRQAKRQPNSMSAQLDAALSFARSGAPDRGIELLEITHRQFPLSNTPVLHLIDAYLASNKTEKAQVLCHLQHRMPSDPQTLLACESVELTNPLGMYRVDGLKTVNQFIKRDDKPKSDFSWVLDRTVYAVDRFGTGNQLVHSIGYINSQDAVSEYGELSIPYGSKVLQARVIKPSLEQFYPTLVEGKPGLSLPNLAVGDFVELETISAIPAHSVFPGGFDTEPFYFRDFNSAFVRSELIVVAPESFNLQFDTRGAAPPPVHHSLNGMQVVTFRTRDQHPLRIEPDTPDAREFLPSVRITAHASIESVCQNINEQLYAMSQWCPEIDQTITRSIVKQNNRDAKIEAIYNWISLNIEDDMILFEPAAHVLSRKRGSRARLFIQMLAQANIDAELGLAMTAFDDHTPATVADVNRYTVPVVKLPNGKWISFQERHAPLGTLPSELRHQPVLLPKNCRIEKTDAGTVPFESSTVTAELNIDQQGNATGTVTELIEGDTAAILRSLLESPESEHRKLFEEHLLSALFPDAVLTAFSVENTREVQLPLKIVYNVAVSQIIKQANNVARMFVPMPVSFEQFTNGIASRELPLVLATYLKNSRKIHLNLPSNMIIQQLPENHCEQSANTVASYCMQFKSSEDSIYIDMEAIINIQRIPARHYTDFQNFILTTKQMNSSSIDIQY